MRISVLMLTAALTLIAGGPVSRAQQIELAPTNHPTLPRELSQMWLAPERGAGPGRASTSLLATAVRLQTDGDYEKSLAVITQPGILHGPLTQYAAYFAAVAQLRLGRADDARRTFRILQAQKPLGYLSEAAAYGEAEADEALDDAAAAVLVYERLLKGKPMVLEDTVLRLGRAAKAAGDLQKASDAFARVYYEFALSGAAIGAGTELALLPNRPAMKPGTQRFKLELSRAERMFGARQYSAARAAFEAIQSAATDDDRELVQLRLAECDYFLKRPRQARDGVRPFLERASRQGEALFFHALASRELGDEGEYLRAVRRIVADFPTQTWPEEALNNLASYFIVRDRDDEADQVFRELYEKYPRGANAERAAWKVGWRAYREGRFSETVRYFERGAADFPRSDYRPAWLYWSARALERSNSAIAAEQRYALVITDYLNSYYGRLAATRLTARASGPRGVAVPEAFPPDSEEAALTPAALPPNAHIIRALLGAELFDAALNELRFAQKMWGDGPAIQATVAWVQQQQARSETGVRRFQLLRGAINIMRRAYPQFMTAGGEDLPRDVLTVIFPIAYWDLIRKHAAARDLDPYLVAALVAQESTFVADIRSHANAYGLMQLLPSTARVYARKLGMRYSTGLLVDAESNIQMGTSYLADKIRQFGDLHLVLASYNAGETAVQRWLSERPGLEREEFIDDIPYPETQMYVKKILGTAEDYRRLYGGVARVNGLDSHAPPPPAAIKQAAPTAKAPAKKPATKKKPAARKRK